MRMLTLAALAVAFFIVPAQAQSVCGPRDKIVKRLADVYQEKRYAMALAANGSLVEIFVAKSGSWTIIVSQPTGPICVVGAGQNWQTEPEPEASNL